MGPACFEAQAHHLLMRGMVGLRSKATLSHPTFFDSLQTADVLPLPLDSRTGLDMLISVRSLGIDFLGEHMASRGVHFSLSSDQLLKLLATSNDDEVMSVIEELEDAWDQE